MTLGELYFCLFVLFICLVQVIHTQNDTCDQNTALSLIENLQQQIRAFDDIFQPMVSRENAIDILNQPIGDYDKMMKFENAGGCVPNSETFDCSICFDTIDVGVGVVLRNCLHSFCKNCLNGLIMTEDSDDVKCPFVSDEYQCGENLQDREIRSLLTQAQYEEYLIKTLRIAEGREQNSCHCQTPNCSGWFIVEDEVNTFTCTVCGQMNCLSCKVRHIQTHFQR